MFEVKVDAVNVVNAAGKAKRFGGRIGRRSDFKKAYVKLAAGPDDRFRRRREVTPGGERRKA